MAFYHSCRHSLSPVTLWPTRRRRHRALLLESSRHRMPLMPNRLMPAAALRGSVNGAMNWRSIPTPIRYSIPHRKSSGGGMRCRRYFRPIGRPPRESPTHARSGSARRRRRTTSQTQSRLALMPPLHPVCNRMSVPCHCRVRHWQFRLLQSLNRQCRPHQLAASSKLLRLPVGGEAGRRTQRG